MTKTAPERIWATPVETVNNQPSWIDEIEVSHADSFSGHDTTGTEYIRTDIADARVAEAVAAERERCAKIAASYIGCENIVAAIREGEGQ